MPLRCCICGRKITDEEECFDLSQRFGGESICYDCGTCLNMIKSLSEKGNAEFREYRKQLVRQLECGHASENGAAYCEQFIIKANTRFKEVCGDKAPHNKPSRETKPVPETPPAL